MRNIKFKAVYEHFNGNIADVVAIEFDFGKVVISFTGDTGAKITKTIDLDSTILLQWTGLKDKNGKEIFEGDVVKVRHDWQKIDATRTVKFENGSFGCKEYRDLEYFEYLSEYDSLEVINNIWEVQ